MILTHLWPLNYILLNKSKIFFNIKIISGDQIEGCALNYFCALKLVVTLGHLKIVSAFGAKLKLSNFVFLNMQ